MNWTDSEINNFKKNFAYYELRVLEEEKVEQIKKQIEDYEKAGFSYLQDDQEFAVPERIVFPSGETRNLRQIDKLINGKLILGDRELLKHFNARDYYDLLYKLPLEERTQYPSYVSENEREKIEKRFKENKKSRRLEKILGGAFVSLVGLGFVGIPSCIGYELVNELDFSPTCGIFGGLFTFAGLINGALSDKENGEDGSEEVF